MSITQLATKASVPKTPLVNATPEVQASQLFTLDDNLHKWVVLHTKPRCEKKIAQHCKTQHIKYFLPLHQSTPKPKKGQRRYSFAVPLFPSYVFACCSAKERYALKCSNYIVRFIETDDQQCLRNELWQLYVATATQADLILYPQLKRGRPVQVSHGPLAGLTGLISKRKDSYRLVLNVSMLGTAAAIEVDMADVEPV